MDSYPDTKFLPSVPSNQALLLVFSQHHESLIFSYTIEQLQEEKQWPLVSTKPSGEVC